MKGISFRVATVYALFTFLFTLPLFSQDEIPANTSKSKLQAPSELIHFGDLVDVDVVGSFEYDWRGTLTPEGFLNGLDRIPKQIYALCRSEGDVAETIRAEYSELLRDPKVVVRIIDRSNRAVASLDGAVRFPQRFQIRRKVYLNELIVISGGFTDRSSGEIRVYRPNDLNCGRNKQESPDETKEKASQNIVVRIPDLLSGKPGSNLQIVSGDIVNAIEAESVFMTGGVNVPKQIHLRNEMTLSRAVAVAGGIAKEGIEEKIRIFRRDPKGPVVIEADLRKIQSKEMEDPILHAFDVVDVEQKGRGPAKLPPFSDITSISDRFSKLPLRIID